MNLFKDILKEHVNNSRIIKDTCEDVLQAAALSCALAISKGKKILLFGNGGSASDAQHLAAEFVVKLQDMRKAYPAIALTTDSSVLTAIGNDMGMKHLFSRQIEALGRKGDVAIGFSTSGNSENVQEALWRAKYKQKMTTIAFLGPNPPQDIEPLIDIAILVPGSNSGRIQEGHILLGHILVKLVEDHLNG